MSDRNGFAYPFHVFFYHPSMKEKQRGLQVENFVFEKHLPIRSDWN